MRYLVFLSLCALFLYAATAEDVYKIYKTHGIDAVEAYLKSEFEPKEVKVKEIKKKEAKKKAKEPSAKELQSKEYWVKQLKDIDVQFGYYEDAESLIVCEKDRKRCDVYKNNMDSLKLVKTHDVIMGKSGDKVKRGDLKTPVGVYEITKRFKPANQFYGPLAFSLSYPNMYDTVRGRSGDGIWIHGSPMDGKDRDDLSKGCVVMDNPTILQLDSEINAADAIVIIGESKVQKVSKENIAAILSEVYKWQHAWKVNDLNGYLAFYSNDFKRSNGMNKKAFSEMKKGIFAKKENKTIVTENMSIIPYPTTDDKKLFKILYYQTYKSPSFASKGEKELYIEVVNDKISILAEK
ncbi:MAG: L,D-transpeptidase family protein [Sulfurospirillaceae bacterium]|nr:L,D-transpeptidase family protein [Sulfurospirillaceae bacterium]MDD2827517.1 L,D-transpeptidase family protein [Sulfurospirillaceae bacterium]